MNQQPHGLKEFGMTEDINESGAATTDVFSALVGIGVPLGVIRDPDSGEKKGMIRHGRELLRVDVDMYEIFYRAVRSASREQLQEWGHKRNITGSGEIIDDALENGLLRDISFDVKRPEVWSELRLVPVGVGRGPDENDRWKIDVPGRESAEVDGITYLTWAASDGRSVREVVDMLSAEYNDADRSLVLIAPLSVFRLISPRAAFLDVVP